MKNLIVTIEAMAARPRTRGSLAYFHVVMKKQRDTREGQQEGEQEQGKWPEFKHWAFRISYFFCSKFCSFSSSFEEKRG